MDRFSNRSQGWDAPASIAFAITPHDTDALSETTRALYVGGAGNVALKLSNGVTVTFTGLAASFVLPVRATHVLATGTTATGLVGLV